MHIIDTKGIIRLITLLGIAVLAFNLSIRANDDGIRLPDLPAGCGGLQISPGNKKSFRLYAQGVQIYRWNGASWDFIAPEANLYASADYSGQIGIHYAGPTWESNNGSKVVARRLASCAPDASSIPWLLLEAVSIERPGVFGKVSYIQRLNTTGGMSPLLPGSKIGEEARVPYTAEYYFYRREN